MKCEECTRLLVLYREAIADSKKAIDRCRGAIDADAALATQILAYLRGNCSEASDAFLSMPENITQTEPFRLTINHGITTTPGI